MKIAVVGAGNQSGRVAGLFSSFRANDPQLRVDIDRDKARALGLPLREVTDALQVFLGSQYINDFDFNSRAYRVFAQADQRFRATRSISADMPSCPWPSRMTLSCSRSSRISMSASAARSRSAVYRFPITGGPPVP